MPLHRRARVERVQVVSSTDWTSVTASKRLPPGRLVALTLRGLNVVTNRHDVYGRATVLDYAQNRVLALVSGYIDWDPNIISKPFDIEMPDTSSLDVVAWGTVAEVIAGEAVIEVLVNE